MSESTVRGTFELSVSDPIQEMRRLRQEARRTSEVFRRTGESMDKIGGKAQTTRIKAYRREVRGLTEDVALLNVELGHLNRRTIRPKVDLRGVNQALAQVSALERALGSLDRKRAGARVGGVGGSLRGGGGGGGAGRSAAFLGSGGIGIATSRTRGLVAAGAAALPIIQSLAGAVGALGGSASMAALGAGAIGAGGLAGLAVGLGGVASIAVPTMKRIGEVKKAQDAYTEAVELYGKRSKQAETAQLKLNAAFKDAPSGTKRLLSDVRALSKEWAKATKPGQRSWVDLLQTGVRTGRALVPTASAAANRVTGATAREGRGLGRFLRGRRTRSFIRNSAATFDENLGSVRRAGQGVAGAFFNVAKASRPFLREATTFIESWTTGWMHATDDIDRTQSKIGKMVDHLRSWMRLGKAGGGLLGSLLGAGAGDGQRMVDKLTRQLTVWDTWVDRNPRQVQDFFSKTTDTALKMAGALGHVASSLNDIATMLRPVLDRFSQLVSLGGAAGLLTPGVGALALGGLRGRKGAAGGGGAAGGAAAYGLGAARGTYSMQRGAFGASRLGAARTAMGGLLGGSGAIGMGARGALAGAGRAFWPVALGLGALDFASYDGDVGGRAQNALSGATLGLIPRPVSDAQRADRGQAKARQFLGGLGTNTGLRAQQAAIGGIRSRLGSNRSALQKGGTRGWAGPNNSIIRNPAYLDEGARRELQAQNRELESALKERLDVYKAYRRARNQELDRTSRSKAQVFAEEYQEGYRRKSKKSGKAKAFESTVSGVLGTIQNQRGSGARDLSQTTLDWARKQAMANPVLQGQYDRLATGIEKRLSKLRGKVRVVQGQILDGSKTQWASIAGAMSSAARRGVSETSAEFTRLRAQAIAAMQLMGLTRGEASTVLKGGSKGRKASEALSRGSAYEARAQLGTGGVGMGVPIPGGPSGDGWGARRGDGAGAGGSASLMGANPGLGGYASEAAGYGLRVSSGRRPGAITNAGGVSYHSSGNALDLAGSPGQMMSFAQHMATKYGGQLEELIYSPMGYSIKNGSRTAPYAVADHYDHVHVADTAPGGGGARGSGGLGGGLGAAPQVASRASKLPGTPGVLSTAAGAGYAAALNMTMAKLAGGGMPGVSGGGGTPSRNQALGRQMMLQRWGAGEWPSLQALWQGESNWDENAVNPSSGAGGIPQALPASKMGAGWQGNARQQIGWGLGYIQDRYGSPSAALAAWQARSPHWYGKGGQGVYRSPTMIGVGDGQPSGGSEEVTVRRLRPGQRPGGQGGGVHLGGITVHVDMRGQGGGGGDGRQLMEQAAEHAARKILEHIRDGVSDLEMA
jgi:hypothetical protein